MEITKHLGDDNIYGVGRKVVFHETDKFLCLSFEGNLDMYMTFVSQKDNYFKITKENYYIYEAFLELYNNIKENNLFEVDNFDLRDARTVEDIEYIYEQNKNLNEWQKKSGHYNELFHNDTIIWQSDDAQDGELKDSGIINIIKKDDMFLLNFTDKVTTIRFRNSRSYYAPYNILFMDLFNKLMKYDPNDNQIHMEEYLYNNKVKTKKR